MRGCACLGDTTGPTALLCASPWPGSRHRLFPTTNRVPGWDAGGPGGISTGIGRDGRPHQLGSVSVSTVAFDPRGIGESRPALYAVCDQPQFVQRSIPTGLARPCDRFTPMLSAQAIGVPTTTSESQLSRAPTTWRVTRPDRAALGTANSRSGRPATAPGSATSHALRYPQRVRAMVMDGIDPPRVSRAAARGRHEPGASHFGSSARISGRLPDGDPGRPRS